MGLITDTRPLVTCACLTRNRREFLPRAIECFLRQTYEPRELLVLDDVDAEPVGDLCISACAGWAMRIVYIRTAWMPFGAKRNRSIELAAGDVVANWDDDDWYAPGRLEDQVGRLMESREPVTGYHNLHFSDGEKWWFYDGAAGFGVDSSLVFWRRYGVLHPYPPVQAGADGAFVREAVVAGQIATSPAKGMMWASVHPGNTSIRKVGQGCYREVACPIDFQ